MKTDDHIEIEIDGHKLMAVGRYYEGMNQWASHKIKEGDADVIDFAAKKMAELVPRNSVIIPVPNHCGYAMESLELAEAIGIYSGMPVVDAIRGNARQSQYQSKYEGHSLTEDEMGFRQVAPLPKDKTPVIIDGVIDTGSTARSAINALGGGTVIAYAMSDTLLDNELATSHCIKR